MIWSSRSRGMTTLAMMRMISATWKPSWRGTRAGARRRRNAHREGSGWSLDGLVETTKTGDQPTTAQQEVWPSWSYCSTLSCRCWRNQEEVLMSQMSQYGTWGAGLQISPRSWIQGQIQWRSRNFIQRTTDCSRVCGDLSLLWNPGGRQIPAWQTLKA